MFPVFAKAREKARQSSCLSNLKQLGLATLSYSQDYDELLPMRYYAIAGGNGNWMYTLAPYMKSTQIYYCPSTKQASYGYNTYYLDRYSLSVIQSPSETVMFGEIGQTTNGTTTYWGEGSLNRPATFGNPPTAPADELNFPVAGDGNYTCRPRATHNDGCNITFVDGHTKWMKTSQFFYQQNPVDKWFDWN